MRCRRGRVSECLKTTTLPGRALRKKVYVCVLSRCGSERPKSHSLCCSAQHWCGSGGGLDELFPEHASASLTRDGGEYDGALVAREALASDFGKAAHMPPRQATGRQRAESKKGWKMAATSARGKLETSGGREGEGRRERRGEGKGREECVRGISGRKG